MTGLPAKTECRECGAPRDPKCRQALCTECATVWRKAQRKPPTSAGLQATYERLRVRELLAQRATR